MGDRHFIVSSTHLEWVNYLGVLLLTATVVGVAFVYKISSLTVPDTRVPFIGSIRQAAARAREENKPVMVDVSVASNTLCNKLDRDVHTRQDVFRMVEHGFVPLKVDPEHSKSAKKFCARYGVTEYPTTLFLDPKGKEFHRIDGYVTPDEFLQEMEIAQSKALAWQYIVVPPGGPSTAPVPPVNPGASGAARTRASAGP